MLRDCPHDLTEAQWFSQCHTRRGRRLGIQGQNLVQGALVGDQTGGDQLLAGTGKRRAIQRQQLTDALIRVIAETLAVADGYQQQI